MRHGTRSTANDMRPGALRLSSFELYARLMNRAERIEARIEELESKGPDLSAKDYQSYLNRMAALDEVYDRISKIEERGY